MKRLVKKANDEVINNAITLLDRIDESSNSLKDIYYSLYDNLNAIYESYPDLYKQMQMVIKLPTNDDAVNIVKFNDDLHQVINHFKDPQYLSSYIEPKMENQDGIQNNDAMLGEDPTNPTV